MTGNTLVLVAAAVIALATGAVVYWAMRGAPDTSLFVGSARSADPVTQFVGNNSAAVLWLLGIVAVFYVSCGTDVFLGSNTIAVYPKFCDGQVVGAACTGRWKRGPRITYTVNADQQFVVSQLDDDPPTRLTKCSVVDKNNWQCTAGLLETQVGFVGGTFQASGPFQGAGVYTTKMDWWLASK